MRSSPGRARSRDRWLAAQSRQQNNSNQKLRLRKDYILIALIQRRAFGNYL